MEIIVSELIKSIQKLLFLGFNHKKGPKSCVLVIPVESDRCTTKCLKTAQSLVLQSNLLLRRFNKKGYRIF